MKRLFTALLISLGFASSTSVQALDWDGFYIQGFGGPNWVHSSKRHNVELNFSTGYAVGGSIGYRMCNGLRFEGEISYRRNMIKSIRIDGHHRNDISFDEFDEQGNKHHRRQRGNRGHLTEVAYMANLICDFDITYWQSCCLCDITPYIGGGIGYGHQLLKSSIIKFRKQNRRSEGKENGFAWQLFAGFAYEFTPDFDAALEYRFHKGRAENIYNNMANFTANYHF